MKRPIAIWGVSIFGEAIMRKMPRLPFFAALALWIAGAQSSWSQTTGIHQTEPSGDGRIQNVQPVTPSAPASRAISAVNPYGWTSLDERRKEQVAAPPPQSPPPPYPRAPRNQGTIIPGGG